MKKLTTILFLSTFIFISFALNAQDISEGMVKMEITDVNSDDQQIAAQLEMMKGTETNYYCLLYTSPSPRDQRGSRMPSSA